MTKIFLVEGTTGEYSDRSDWVVCAYRNKEKAEEHARNAMLRAKEIEKNKVDRYEEPVEKNEYDPKMQMDYTGTSYYVINDVELR